MKKWIVISFATILILALSILLIINQTKPDYTITGSKNDFTYIINDPIPDLLEGVKGTKDGKVIEIVLDGDINWNVPGQYYAQYKYNNTILETITILVVHRAPYIVNTINLVYYIGEEELNFFATDIRAYDIHGRDITYNSFNERRVVVDDNLVNYEKIGNYLVEYNVTDDYGNVGKAQVEVSVRKSDPSPVIYGIEEPIYLKLSSSLSILDLLNGVSAYSNTGEDLSRFIIIDDSLINTNNTGVYPVEYMITDNDITSKYSREVVVLSENEPLIDGVNDYKIIDLGDLFIDFSLGIKVYDYYEKDITDNLQIMFRIKETEDLMDISQFYSDYINEVGDYFVVFQATNSLLETSYKEMYVKVINDVEAPTISGTKDIIFKASESKPDLLEGISAYKYYDDLLSIDLTKEIKVKIYKNYQELDINTIDFTKIDYYTIVYIASDDNGNTKEIERNLYIIDVNEPVFYNIKESFSYYIKEEEPDPIPDYKEGVVAWDLVDGDLTSLIDVKDYVNYSIPGEYYIEYVVSDNQGNQSIKSVIVYVFTS